jgi:glyoxylase-like metal-dependent hydrolase (beta-lactamase superfamily II)/rhodanese-related sulfurtransferase
MKTTPITTPETLRDPGHAATRPVVEQTRVGGCLSYLVYDPETCDAAVIDPRFDSVDAIRTRLAEGRLRLAFAIDTHAHADHVSGVARLAHETGARAIVSSEVAFPAQRVRQGDRLALGRFALEVIETPGHTSDSVTLKAGGAVFTGDALLIGSAGRTDFQNGSPETLFETFESRLRGLPADTVVYPGHDYRGRTHTTIGDELRANALFANRDRAAFVARLRAGRQAEPANMRFVLAANRSGATSDVRVVEPVALKGRLDGGEHLDLVDVRSPEEFAASRIAGARNVPLDLVASAAGSIAPGVPLVLICEAGVRASMATTAFAGLPGVHVLEGGMSGWRRAGLPTEGVPGGVWPIERQVRCVIGACVVVGAVLGLAVNPWFFVVPIFFGAGLVFSAVTGRCGMAMLLAKLPWNRRALAALAAADPDAAGGSCAVGGGPPGGGCAAG